MLAEVTGASCHWFCTGQEVFPAMLAAIDAAEHSVCLETYIYSAGALGERFREALTRARQRRVRVRVLIDGLGSYGLPAAFWQPLTDAGGEVRVFNPLSLNRMGIRDHRKLLVCDERIAFLGGFNIAREYEGDGVNCGWCDLGVKVEGSLAGELAASFEDMFERADFQHKRFIRLRKSRARLIIPGARHQLLLSGPGRGPSPIKRALLRDLAQAQSVQIVTAYFLPTWKLRRHFVNVVRRGGRVELILPGKSDVSVSQLAARSLYRRLLKGGIEIHEYQPQVLHAKLIVADNLVYVGSANLDQRSLNINYELMLRFDSPEIAGRAREIFGNWLGHCQPITLQNWTTRSFWQRLKQRWAYLLLVRLDPYIARWQWRQLPD